MTSSRSKLRTNKRPPKRRGHDSTPTGAGSEAAAGIRGAGVGKLGGRSTTPRETGRSHRAGAERAGSEPLIGRDVIHKSGYGGEGGKPRTSSDQREPAAGQQPASRK